MHESFSVFAVIVLSSLCWSLFDTSRKSLSGHLSAAAAVFWLMLLQAPIFLAFAFSDAWIVPLPNYWLPAAVSLALNLLSNIWFVESVRLAPLSLAIPILALTPVFSATGGFLLLGEATSLRQAFGILIIVTATFLLGRHSARNQLDATENARVRRGLLLMMLVALLFALTPVFDKMCLRDVPASEHAFLQCLSVAMTAALYLFARRQPLDLRSALASRWWLVAAVVFAAGALFTQFWAIRLVPVGMFEALKRSFGLVWALVLGYFIFKEPITRAKLIAVAAIATGIAILLT